MFLSFDKLGQIIMQLNQTVHLQSTAGLRSNYTVTCNGKVQGTEIYMYMYVICLLSVTCSIHVVHGDTYTCT